jgi:tetratricopeptide (TPR) repeat protein
VSARLGEVEWRLGELERALVRMEGAFEVLSGDEPDEDLAMLAVELGRLHFFAGEIDLAAQRVDRAIEIAESLWLPEVISEALNTQGLIATFNGRSEQAVALLQHALELALDHDLTAAALRAYNNLGDLFDRRDRYEEAIEVHRRGLALARKAGNAIQGWRLAGELSYCLMRTGQWEEALQIAGELPESGLAFSLSGFQAPAEIAIARGDLAWAERLFRYLSGLEASADVQDRASYFASRAMLLTAEGRFEDALRSSREALVAVHRLGPGIGADGKLAYRAGLEALLALGRLDALDELLREIEAVPPGKLAPYLRALAARYRARLADVHGEDAAVEPSFKTASATFREYDLLFELAVTQLEHGEWLVGRGRAGEAESLLTEAGGIFTRLETRPWVERLERAAVPLPA